MSLRKLLIWGVFSLVGIMAAGCGPITASTVVKQGAMWVGKEVIKKEYKEYKAHKRGENGSARSSASR